MIETIVGGLIVALIVGLTGLAIRDQSAFRKIHPIISKPIAYFAMGASVWNCGSYYTAANLLNIIDKRDQIEEMRKIVDQSTISLWYMLAIALFYLYLVLLLYIRSILWPELRSS